MNPHEPPPAIEARKSVTRPRPGHADLAGALKYGTHDARDILERASARETAARVAAGALAKALLGACGIEVTSRTLAVGTATAPDDEDFDALLALPDDAPMRTTDASASAAMIAEVERAKRVGDSIGGVFEVLARGVPPGLGSHVHWDRRLDGRLGGAILLIQAVKAASVGGDRGGGLARERAARPDRLRRRAPGVHAAEQPGRRDRRGNLQRRDDPRQYELGPAQIEQMRSLYWEKDPHSPNFTRVMPARSDGERTFIARVIKQTFVKVYGMKPKQEIVAEMSSPNTPMTQESMKRGWDPVAYAETMKKSTSPVSAFFLIDSLDAIPRCKQWLVPC